MTTNQSTGTATLAAHTETSHTGCAVCAYLAKRAAALVVQDRLGARITLTDPEDDTHAATATAVLPA